MARGLISGVLAGLGTLAVLAGILVALAPPPADAPPAARQDKPDAAAGAPADESSADVPGVIRPGSLPATPAQGAGPAPPETGPAADAGPAPAASPASGDGAPSEAARRPEPPVPPHDGEASALPPAAGVVAGPDPGPTPPADAGSAPPVAARAPDPASAPAPAPATAGETTLRPGLDAPLPAHDAVAALAPPADALREPAAAEPPAPPVPVAPAAPGAPAPAAPSPPEAEGAPDDAAAAAGPPPALSEPAEAAPAALAGIEPPAPRPVPGAARDLPAPPHVAGEAPAVPDADPAVPSSASPVGVAASPGPAEASPAADRGTPSPPSPPPNPPPPAVTARPAPGFGGVAPGVQTGRLPQVSGIGAAPAAPGAEAVPQAEAEAALPAWRRHARPFENPAGKPPFAIILIDDGSAAGVDRAALAAGPVPITLALDAAAHGAADRAAAWRAAGQEVLVLGAALPQGAAPSDAEVTVEALLGAVPAAVGLIDLPEGGVQGDRTAAAMLIAAMAPRGLGLVTWDRGLNSADQIARRTSLPAAVVFRDLDAAGADVASIRRTLDRAAFRAAQEGWVVVAGRLRPATVEAILSWAMEPRAATVALAPVSAIFARP